MPDLPALFEALLGGVLHILFMRARDRYPNCPD